MSGSPLAVSTEPPPFGFPGSPLLNCTVRQCTRADIICAGVIARHACTSAPMFRCVIDVYLYRCLYLGTHFYGGRVQHVNDRRLLARMLLRVRLNLSVAFTLSLTRYVHLSWACLSVCLREPPQGQSKRSAKTPRQEILGRGKNSVCA